MMIATSLTARLILAAMVGCFAFAAAAAPGGNGNGKGNPGGPGGGGDGGDGGEGFVTVSGSDWDDTAVRKVLHTFAYGGHATEDQIFIWADMAPADAIAEMLTFDYTNLLLSTPEVGDGTSGAGTSIEGLQNFWSLAAANNPVRPDKYGQFAPFGSSSFLSGTNFRRTWVQATNTRGLNPFLHKTGLFLTNYHAAIHIKRSGTGLMRSYYDDTIAALADGEDFFFILALASESAALARAYGHRNNRMRNGAFQGNDDFAREFHQLLFGILGTTEDPDYHEDVTIENTARVLTGMQVERADEAYGLGTARDFIAPIVFLDYIDGTDRKIWNIRDHHTADLEILGNPLITGLTAQDKIFQLADWAGTHPESLDNLPVKIVGFFADDNLTDAKIATLRTEWAAMNPPDLLTFLQAYAISTTFHASDRVKYASAFQRNLLIHNLNVLTNEETFARANLPITRMSNQGARAFEPVHNVFGGQTGLDAANNPDVFKDAYTQNVVSPGFLRDVDKTYTNFDNVEVEWFKDWSAVIPPNGDGEWVVGDVAAFLWQRFIADGGKNYDPIIKAQIQSILATGRDFGYAVSQIDPTADPNAAYTSKEITRKKGDLRAIDEAHAATVMKLDPSGIYLLKDVEVANERIGIAINLITATPFMFAMEGK